MVCFLGMSGWMTLDQAAEHLQVSKPTLHRWVREGKLAVYDLPSGGGRRFRRQDLDNYVQPGARLRELIQEGLERSSRNGHLMEHLASDGRMSAYYRCRACGAAFTVGHNNEGPAGVLQLVAADACEGRCSNLQLTLQDLQPLMAAPGTYNSGNEDFHIIAVMVRDASAGVGGSTLQIARLWLAKAEQTNPPGTAQGDLIRLAGPLLRDWYEKKEARAGL